MSTAASLRLLAASSLAARPAQPVDLADLRTYAFTFTLRGTVVLTAALGNYTLEHVGFAAPWLPWMVLMPLVGIGQGIRNRRQRRQQPNVNPSATAKTMRLLQKSFLAVILIAIVCATQLGWEKVHPLLLVMYGLSTFAAGRVLRFRPLWLGGIACGLLGLLAATVPADTQLLLIAAAMLLSYIIPGYLLRKQGQEVR